MTASSPTSAHAFVEWLSAISPHHFDEHSRGIVVGHADAYFKSVFRGRVMVDDLEESDVVWIRGESVLTSRETSGELIATNTIASSYNCVRAGGLLIATSSTPGFHELLDRMFAEQGFDLDEAFFDYAMHRAEDGTELFVGVKFGEDAAFLPDLDRDGVTLKKKHGKRELLYVACMSIEECEAAAEDLQHVQSARIAFVPTSWWGHHLAYAHTLPSRRREWEHADRVGLVRWRDGLSREILHRQKRETPESAIVASDLEGQDLLRETSRLHPEFAPVWTWVLTKLGYKEQNGSNVPVVPPDAWWLASPVVMEAYTEAFGKFRALLDGVDVPDRVRAALWSSCGRDDRRMAREEKMAFWGTTKEPHHRILAEKFASFFFWIRCFQISV